MQGTEADPATAQEMGPQGDVAASERTGADPPGDSLGAKATDDGLPVAAAAGALAAVLFAAGGPLLAQAGPSVAAREGLVAALQSWLDAYPIPLVMGLPPALLHWSHAGNTLSVLLVVGGVGVYEAFAVRRRRLQGKRPQANVHSAAMSAVLLYSLVAAVGAIASMRYDKQPILESPHAWTSLLVLALLLANASMGIAGTLGSAAPRNAATDSAGTAASPAAAAREAHARVGVAALAAVAITAVFGTLLGLSFGPAEQAAAGYSSMGNLDLSDAPGME